jgi:1,4-alpha-glucan branching enzyme
MVERVPGESGGQKAAWRTIYFRIEAPDAAQVSLVGDFNGWDPQRHGLPKNPSGVWECQVPLPPGRYAHLFVVDGARRLDPHCAQQAADAAGVPCCVIDVSPPDE